MRENTDMRNSECGYFLRSIGGSYHADKYPKKCHKNLLKPGKDIKILRRRKNGNPSII